MLTVSARLTLFMQRCALAAQRETQQDLRGVHSLPPAGTLLLCTLCQIAVLPCQEDIVAIKHIAAHRYVVQPHWPCHHLIQGRKESVGQQKSSVALVFSLSLEGTTSLRPAAATAFGSMAMGIIIKIRSPVIFSLKLH